MAALQLYRTAPQSVADARVRSLIVARPSNFTPRIERAEQQYAAARASVGAGNDSIAMAALADAAGQAWTARGFAEDDEDSRRATTLWGYAMLGRAALLQAAGTGSGLRRDDNELLRQALALVQQVVAQPVPPLVGERAQQMQDAIERKLRPRPLEWLPSPR